jgi:hypothetical protein
MTHLRRWSTPIHENSELGHSLSKEGLRIRILEERILPMPVLTVLVVRIRNLVEVNGVILEGRLVS